MAQTYTSEIEKTRSEELQQPVRSAPMSMLEMYVVSAICRAGGHADAEEIWKRLPENIREAEQKYRDVFEEYLTKAPRVFWARDPNLPRSKMWTLTPRGRCAHKLLEAYRLANIDKR
jgi:hypothetical protein